MEDSRGGLDPQDRLPILPSDYRPISLLPVLSKLMERLVSTRLSFWLETNSLLPQEQAGFRPGQSAEFQLTRVTEDIHRAWRRGEVTVAVFLDVRKAFDTVWRDGLIHKLQHVARVQGQMLHWIRAFLNGRSASFRADGATSAPVPLHSGVPQGAVLSPLLYNIFTADILSTLPRSVIASVYADDTAIYFNLRPHRDSTVLREQLQPLQQALDAIHRWFAVWRLTLAPPKTKLRVFFPHNSPPPQALLDLLSSGHLHINNQPLHPDPNPSTRYLGLWLDSHLLFTDHLQKIVDRTTRRLTVLRWLSSPSRGGQREILLALFRAWIRPLGEYGCAAFGGIHGHAFTQLDNLHTSALRIAIGANKCSAPLSVFIEAGFELPPPSDVSSSQSPQSPVPTHTPQPP